MPERSSPRLLAAMAAAAVAAFVLTALACCAEQGCGGDAPERATPARRATRT